MDVSNESFTTNTSGPHYSNESFPTDAFGPDFSNESFTTNTSGPHFSNESFTTNTSGLYFSNESFTTNTSRPHFSNESFTTNTSGPHFSNESFTTNTSGLYFSNESFKTNASRPYFSNGSVNTNASGLYFLNESFTTNASGPDFSNEPFTTDMFAQDFANESFMTNVSAPVFSSVTSPAEPAVIITVAVLAIVGNLLVIAVTTRRQTFPSASRLFISSMAYSDLILGLTFAFFVAPAGAGEWVYSDTTARACAVIAETSLALSLSALAGLNLDRHYALMNDGAGISPKKARIFLVSAWVGIYACVDNMVFWTPKHGKRKPGKKEKESDLEPV
ncbi:CH17-360D5.1 [Branchiostoma lanceolatum]|uniref:CH17-360D5.1 protein n=1 Tax=Branchiostoma lanceolatum TaxID=7740 RepID=A0A8K0ENY4_BRALA|nr:CH17-360D5.1 [Branchiostoma lanceolatum]